MRDDQEQAYWAWCIHDALWERIKPLSPTWKSYPLGSHRPHVDDRKAMDAIFVVLCTGGQ